MCVAAYVEQVHLTHVQADEPHEITRLMMDSCDGISQEEATRAFICQARENIVAGVRYLAAMATGSPEALAAISSVTSVLDGLSNIPGLLG